MGNLILSVIVVFLILGGPLTLYAIVKITSIVLGGLKVRFAKIEGSDTPHLMVSWDNETYDIKVCRIKIEFDEMVKNGRSKMISFTFEDNKAKTKSFIAPMKLDAEELACFTDAGSQGLRYAFQKSYFMVEVETVNGETQQFRISKSKVQAQLADLISVDTKLVDLSPEITPDKWSVLTRVFPWRKVVAVAESTEGAEGGAVASAGSDAPRAPVDFKVTKVWIEPGCIVCDACENEAPAVFWVKEDTCVVRDNAPLGDAAAIKAAAEGCPVDVIKFDKVALDKAG